MSRICNNILKVYVPFICTLAALLNGAYILCGFEPDIFIQIFASLTGNSILIDLYILAVADKMCIWYKLNALFLLLIQISGLLYNLFEIDESLYLFMVVLFASCGTICFLVYRFLNKIIHLFQYIGRCLRK